MSANETSSGLPVFGAYCLAEQSDDLQTAQDLLIARLGGQRLGVLRAVILSQRELVLGTGCLQLDRHIRRIQHARSRFEAEASHLADRSSTGLLLSRIHAIDHPSRPDLTNRFLAVEVRSPKDQRPQPAEQLRRAARFALESSKLEVRGGSRTSVTEEIRFPYIPLVTNPTRRLDRLELTEINDKLASAALPAVTLLGPAVVNGIERWV